LISHATGLAPTWPAVLHGVGGIPIDQVLASRDWRLVPNNRGPAVGSDHLPVLARLTPLGDR
jgi:endonuclease/exonuclease/phosphatase (EEP) superfamily protein YafD